MNSLFSAEESLHPDLNLGSMNLFSESLLTGDREDSSAMQAHTSALAAQQTKSSPLVGSLSNKSVTYNPSLFELTEETGQGQHFNNY